MKKNVLVLCGFIAALGAVMFWNQQSPMQSAASDLDKIEASDTSDKQAQSASSLSNKVEIDAVSEVDVVVEIAINDDSDSNEKEPATLEEAVEQARLAVFKSSGLQEKHHQAGLALERHNQRMQSDQANRLGHNDSAKKHLNIDVVKEFNVDLDAEMEAVQARGQAEHDAALDKQLAAMGVEPERRKELAIMRAQLLGTVTIIDE